MAYVAESDDPDALVNHPLQPDVQHAHVIAAPLLEIRELHKRFGALETGVGGLAPEQVLADKYSMVISRDLSRRLFGEEEAVGRSVVHRPSRIIENARLRGTVLAG